MQYQIENKNNNYDNCDNDNDNINNKQMKVEHLYYLSPKILRNKF